MKFDHVQLLSRLRLDDNVDCTSTAPHRVQKQAVPDLSQHVVEIDSEGKL